MSDFKIGRRTILKGAAVVGAAQLVAPRARAAGTEGPVKIGIDNAKATPEAARRFLEQAAFGPSPSDALAVQI